MGLLAQRARAQAPQGPASTHCRHRHQGRRWPCMALYEAFSAHAPLNHNMLHRKQFHKRTVIIPASHTSALHAAQSQRTQPPQALQQRARACDHASCAPSMPVPNAPVSPGRPPDRTPGAAPGAGLPQSPPGSSGLTPGHCAGSGSAPYPPSCGAGTPGGGGPAGGKPPNGLPAPSSAAGNCSVWPPGSAPAPPGRP